MRRYRIGLGAEVVLAFTWAAFAAPVGFAQPSNVRLLSQVPGHFFAVRVEGHYAYLSNEFRFRILDVSDPSSPVDRGSLDLYPDGVGGLDVTGSLAYLANGTGGLRIVDVTNPSSPTVRGSYHTAHYPGTVFTADGLAYLTEWAGGLEIVDVTNPTTPTLRGSYDTPDLARDVFVSGGLAYVADRSSLQILDVTNPSSPTLRGAYQDPSGARICDVFVSGHIAYVTTTSGDDWTGHYARFLSLDVSNPAAPRLLGSYGTPGCGGGLYVSGDFAYVLLGYDLHILDISAPSFPRLRGFHPVDGAAEGWGRIVASGGLVYIAVIDPGFMILEFTPPPLAANRWQLYR